MSVKDQDKRRTLPHHAVYRNLAAVRLTNGFGNGQPESGFPTALLEGFIDTSSIRLTRNKASVSFSTSERGIKQLPPNPIPDLIVVYIPASAGRNSTGG